MYCIFFMDGMYWGANTGTSGRESWNCLLRCAGGGGDFEKLHLIIPNYLRSIPHTTSFVFVYPVCLRSGHNHTGVWFPGVAESAQGSRKVSMRTPKNRPRINPYPWISPSCFQKGNNKGGNRNPDFPCISMQGIPPNLRRDITRGNI